MRRSGSRPSGGRHNPPLEQTAAAYTSLAVERRACAAAAAQRHYVSRRRIRVRAISWRILAQRLDPESEFAAPVTRDEIAAAETALKIAFPDELREFLLETDGVEGKFGLARVWPLARIVKDNLDFRSNADFPSLYMPFEPLLFIGDEGGGDQYAYRILTGKIENLDIFVWEHESDSRNWFARDLRDYLARSAGHEQYDPAKHGGAAAN